MDLNVPRTGTRMGKYRVGKMIGRGAFGIVCEVARSPRSLVLKIRDVSEFSALQQEMNMCNMLLNVGGVPRIHDIGTSGNYCWMVMDHAGISLYDIFQKIEVVFMPKDSRENVTAFLGSQILGRLQQVHFQGVVHGDIQPGNITLCFDDHDHIVHLIDFGSAAVEGGCSSEINWYFASAQHCTALLEEREHSASRTDDIVSLAFLLIRMVSGDLPWEPLLTPRGSPTDLEEVIRYKRRPPKSMTKGVQRVFRRFLKYALKLPPSARYEDIDYTYYINTLYQFSLREFQTPK